MSNTVIRTIMKLRKSSCVDRSIFREELGESSGQQVEQRDNVGDFPGSFRELNPQVTGSFKEKEKYVKNRCMKVVGSAELFMLV